MKKLLYLTLILGFTTTCYANPGYDFRSSSDFRPSPTNPHLKYNSSVVIEDEVDGADALADMPLRIAGFLTTVVGTGVFVAVSPLAGLMATYPPHDATYKIIDYLILQPGRYTFERSVGDFNYNPHEVKNEANTGKED
jgi:hypothetical protein